MDFGKDGWIDRQNSVGLPKGLCTIYAEKGVEEGRDLLLVLFSFLFCFSFPLGFRLRRKKKRRRKIWAGKGKKETICCYIFLAKCNRKTHSFQGYMRAPFL